MGEEEISEATEIQRVGGDAIAYGGERQAIGTQLELMSQVSEGHNSIMGSSPIRSSRISTRKNKNKIEK